MSRKFTFYLRVSRVLFVRLTPALIFTQIGPGELFRIPTWLKDNLPSFEYFRKITLTKSLQKARRYLYDTISTHPEKQHLPFKQTETTITIF